MTRIRINHVDGSVTVLEGGRFVNAAGPGWTTERLAVLRKLWPTCSASEIAKVLGVTRNAVIGKAYRLKLRAKAVSAKSPGRPAREMAKPYLSTR